MNQRRTYESEEKLCVGGEAVESDEKPLNPTRSLSIRGEGVNRRRRLPIGGEHFESEEKLSIESGGEVFDVRAETHRCSPSRRR